MNKSTVQQLLSMFADDTGNLSSMRVLLLVGCGLILSPSIYIAFKTGQPPVFTPQQLGICAGLLGGKLIQNVQEAPSTTTTVTTGSPAAPTLMNR